MPDTEAIQQQCNKFQQVYLSECEWTIEKETAAKCEFGRIITALYADAMERAIKAVERKANYTDAKGNTYTASIGHLEAEIAIRQELTEDAGGEMKVIGPTDANQEGKHDEDHIH